MSQRVAVWLLALTSSAYGQLSLNGVKCGQLTCALGEYCSPETDRCAPCSDVCNKTHHNYDVGLCVKQCQGKLCLISHTYSVCTTICLLDSFINMRFL